MIRVAQDYDCPELRCADVHLASFDDAAHAKAVIPAVPSLTPGRSQKSRCQCAREVLKTGSSRGAQRDTARRSASCAMSRHSPLATGLPDASARTANAATVTPCVCATRRRAAADIGSGHGRKHPVHGHPAAVRHGLPARAEVREEHYAARRLGTPIRTKGARKADVRRSVEVRGVGELGAYELVSQGAEGSMYQARSAPAEPLSAGGGDDI
ncbi:hypothetical protein EDB89DRAFT_1294845 [Lactarius sanguifluus]|nr:hypothetical protein EDB89DRAFT_1294845 [Lactarius sanguifluus]